MRVLAVRVLAEIVGWVELVCVLVVLRDGRALAVVDSWVLVVLVELLLLGAQRRPQDVVDAEGVARLRVGGRRAGRELHGRLGEALDSARLAACGWALALEVWACWDCGFWPIIKWHLKAKSARLLKIQLTRARPLARSIEPSMRNDNGNNNNDDDNNDPFMAIYRLCRRDACAPHSNSSSSRVRGAFLVVVRKRANLPLCSAPFHPAQDR